jgi:hypothetical protein
MIVECELQEVDKITERRITGINNRRRRHPVMLPDDYVDRRTGSGDRRSNAGWSIQARRKPVSRPHDAG